MNNQDEIVKDFLKNLGSYLSADLSFLNSYVLSSYDLEVRLAAPALIKEKGSALTYKDLLAAGILMKEITLIPKR